MLHFLSLGLVIGQFVHIDNTDPIYAMCQTGMHAEEELRTSYGRG